MIAQKLRCLPVYMASYPVRCDSSTTPPWDPQISQNKWVIFVYPLCKE